MSPTLLDPSCNAFYAFQSFHGSNSNLLYDYHNRTDIHIQQPYCSNLAYHQPIQYYIGSHMMDSSNPSEMDDFQRLSDNYQANLPGPLIGEKLPLSVLATEYAQADSTYVVKTAALANSYSAYRTIKGDGQCGWRATVFGYFETLLQLGDITTVKQERIRLQSFEQTMQMAGIEYEIIADMFDYTWDLFDALQTAVERQDRNEAVLMALLNDGLSSDSIVYHFKMMTSAYMQLHADQYEPFLEMPIADYRASRIDPANQEIDQIGLQALTDAVIAPAEFAVEVLYLDLSQGEEVTPHSFVGNSSGKPTIRLLYRPGHYDMIYKQTTSVQVFMQGNATIPQGIEMAEPSAMSEDLRAYLLPGPVSSQPSSQNSSFYEPDQSSGGRSRQHYTYAPRLQQVCIASDGHFDQYRPQPLPLMNVEFPRTYPLQYSSPCPTDMSSSPYPPTPPPATRAAAPTKLVTEPQIRLSANCFNYRLRHASVPLCSQNYGSAALSTAHFRNQEFQPHIWRAEDEYLKP